MFDLLIQHAWIVDGTGRPGFQGDIAVQGDRIAAVGALDKAEAVQVYDAAGKVAAPGFIDIHTHSDLSLLEDGRALARLHDGVTTDVIGNCGIGCAPVREENRQLLVDYLGTRMIGSLPIKIDLPWRTEAEYLAYVNAHAPSINLAPLVAQGAVRIAEMGFAQGKASAQQVEHMQYMVQEAMEAGALGITTGLAYLPGAYTGWEELRDVTKPVSKFGGAYISHIRNQSEGIFDSLDEAVRIGRGAGVPVHISHLKLAGPMVRGQAGRLLDYIHARRQEGMDITYDLYPYEAGNTALTTVLPPWVFEGGIHNLLQRVADPIQQERIIRDCSQGIPGWQNYSKDLGWDKIQISTTVTEEGKQWEGLTIAEAAQQCKKEPWDMVFDLLIQERGRVQTIVYHLDPQDVDTIVTSPGAMYGSDTMSLAAEGVLSFGKPHPRAYGTHGRILGRYVRERKQMTLEEAVRKMTSMPAHRMRLRERGEIRSGYYSDLTIFDPETIRDRADYANPKQYTEGVDCVIVNGKIVLRDGIHQGVFSGRVVGR